VINKIFLFYFANNSVINPLYNRGNNKYIVFPDQLFSLPTTDLYSSKNTINKFFAQVFCFLKALCSFSTWLKINHTICE